MYSRVSGGITHLKSKSATVGGFSQFSDVL